MKLFEIIIITYSGLLISDIVFMACLHFFYDSSGYYKYASFAWAGMLLSLVGEGFFSNFGLNHLFGLPLVIVFPIFYAKLCAMITEERFSLSKIWVFAATAWSVAAICHFSLSLSFELVALLAVLGPAAAFFYLSYILFKVKSKGRNIIHKIIAFALALEGLHLLDYPFLRHIEGTEVFGFGLAIIIAYFLSIATPVAIMSRISANMEENLRNRIKEKVDELASAQSLMVESSRLAALGEMAGGIAHEINNPLAIVIGRSNVVKKAIAKGTSIKDLEEQLNSIIDSASRVTRIIDGLRKFSRSDSTTDDMQEIDLRKLVDECLDLCREKFQSHGVQLTVSFPKKPVPINVNQTRMGQVIINLLNNAFDAVRDKQSKKIEVRVDDNQDSSVVSIHDNGPGIPTEIRQKILQPFFTTKPIGEGTGLGLSISYGIVKENHGKLEFESEPGKTVFKIGLPKTSMDTASDKLPTAS